MIEHATTVQARWSDVDPAGIVFYPRFFEWYDLGCETLFAAGSSACRSSSRARSS